VDDQSALDSKYFLGIDTYNCPYCNRRHITYSNQGKIRFDWSNEKGCWIWLVQCGGCGKKSLHLTYKNLQDQNYSTQSRFRADVDLDQAFFYSVPTSFFVVDRRIPRVIRELITEAEGCAKMNFLTGASACTRKAIYELLAIEGVTGANYDDRIKALKTKHANIDPELFEVLGHVKDMTSDHVHEESWVAWDSSHLHLFLESLRAVLHEIFVVPDERITRAASVKALRGQLGDAKAAAQPAGMSTEGDASTKEIGSTPEGS
jgi:hypothetical protein